MTEIKIDHNEYGLESTKAQEISNMFKPMLDRMTALEVQYNDVINLPMEPETIQQAHDLRLAYVKVRTGTAEIHSKLKKFYLQGGRFVDGWKNAQAMASQGMEEKLRSIEDHFVNIEKEKVTKLQEERAAELKPFTEFIPEQLGDMDPDVWDKYLFGVKASYNKAQEDDRLAEEKRIKDQKAEERRQSIIRKQNHALRVKNKKLQEEQDEKDRIAKGLLEKQQKEKDELQAKLDEEQRIKDQAAKEEEERIQAELKMGDKEKLNSFNTELTVLAHKYTYKSKRYKVMDERLEQLINNILLEISPFI